MRAVGEFPHQAFRSLKTQTLKGTYAMTTTARNSTPISMAAARTPPGSGLTQRRSRSKRPPRSNLQLPSRASTCRVPSRRRLSSAQRNNFCATKKTPRRKGAPTQRQRRDARARREIRSRSRGRAPASPVAAHYRRARRIYSSRPCRRSAKMSANCSRLSPLCTPPGVPILSRRVHG